VQQEPAKGTDSGERSFTPGQRFKARLIGWAGYLAISLICRTVRWRSEGDEHLHEIYRSGHRAVFTFWHGRIFPATYYWRNRGIVVMTSMNLDGEAIAQCIQKFGYSAARGSSSRGGLRALAQLIRDIQRGRDAAFTIDGRAARANRQSRVRCCWHTRRRCDLLLPHFNEAQDPAEELG
jgi:lysophospholipid acyltransferase (LPLAT)-like uncharacterized protein